MWKNIYQFWKKTFLVIFFYHFWKSHHNFGCCNFKYFFLFKNQSLWIAFKNDFASISFFFTIFSFINFLEDNAINKTSISSFKNSIKKSSYFQSFLNSSETRLQHFFALRVCFWCLYGNKWKIKHLICCTKQIINYILINYNCTFKKLKFRPG